MKYAYAPIFALWAVHLWFVFRDDVSTTPEWVMLNLITSVLIVNALEKSK